MRSAGTNKDAKVSNFKHNVQTPQVGGNTLNQTQKSHTSIGDESNYDNDEFESVSMSKSNVGVGLGLAAIAAKQGSYVGGQKDNKLLSRKKSFGGAPSSHSDDYSQDFDSVSVSKSISVSQAKKSNIGKKQLTDKKQNQAVDKFANNYSPIKEEGANPASDSLTQSKQKSNKFSSASQSQVVKEEGVESSEDDSDSDSSDDDDDDDEDVPPLDGKNLTYEDILKKYTKKGSKKGGKNKKLTSVNQAVLEASAEDTSSYSMTMTSDPTGSKNMQNQLTKFMANDYNVSTSNVSVSGPASGKYAKDIAWKNEGGQISTVKESDDSSEDEDYSQSMTVTGSGPKSQKERFEEIRKKYLNQ